MVGSNLLGTISVSFPLAISNIKGYFFLLRTKMESFKYTLEQKLVSYYSNNPHNKHKINKIEEIKTLFYVFNIVCLPAVLYINYMIFLDSSLLHLLAKLIFFSSTLMFWSFSICLNYDTNRKPLHISMIEFFLTLKSKLKGFFLFVTLNKSKLI